MSNLIKICFLIDNEQGPSTLPLKVEHGLSLLIYWKDKKILFDTGQSNNFIDNAQLLGENLRRVDYGVISHGHYDHGGGLEGFFSVNQSAPVFAHKQAVPSACYHPELESAKFIGIAESVYTGNRSRFKLIEYDASPSEGVHLLVCDSIDGRGPLFADHGLTLLMNGKHIEDRFDHEIFLVIERDKDIVIVSGCSHNSITAILKHAKKMFKGKTVSSVVGGFHLPDIKTFSVEHESVIRQTADDLLRLAPEAMYYTGHCTGNKAKALMKEIMEDRISFFYSGAEYNL